MTDGSVLMPFTTQHRAAAARLHAACFDRPWSETEFSELLQGGAAGFALTIPHTEQLAGMLLWRIAAEEAEILTFAVAASHRRQGLGRRLLQSAMAQLPLQGVSRLLLEVRADNHPACQLYEQLGFTRYATRKGYYRLAAGRWEDAALYHYYFG